MNMYKLEGRATFGIAVDLAYGSLLLFMAIFMAATGWELLISDAFSAFIFLFIAGLTAFLFIHLATCIKIKRLEVDGRGVKFYAGEKLKWSFLWQEMDSVFSSSFSGKYPRSGFGFKVHGKSYHINNRDTMGPKESLKEAFRIIAREATRQGIPVEDYNSWANDIISDMVKQRNIPPVSEMGVSWQKT